MGSIKGGMRVTDFSFYSEVYGGVRSEEEIMPMLKLADIIVSSWVCCGDISDKLSFAACIQADFYAECGGYHRGYSSVKIGDFSLSGGVEGGALCDAAKGYLEREGLLYRGGVCLC